MLKLFLKYGLGPLFFILSLGEGSPQIIMLGIVGWMLSWWISEAVPMGVTALLPMVLFPLSGIENIKAVTAHYANPIIYLFFGGFVLGLAIERWNLHRRIALNIMLRTGNKPRKVILGTMLATALLSTLISNTATTIMMLPIGLSVVQLLSQKISDAPALKSFTLAMLLGIAYAANVGGMTTLIGTPPNLVLAGLISEAGLPEISFARWLLFALPLVVLLFILLYWLLTRVLLKIHLPMQAGIQQLLRKELKQLGVMGTAEKRTAAIVAITAALWMLRPQLSNLLALPALNDTIIAIAMAILLFVWPSGKKPKQPLLVWKDTQRLPWGILLLFGGGISIANGMEQTKIVNRVGEYISASPIESVLLMILIITALSIFLTEVMSNVALVSVFIPIALIIARQSGMGEMQLAVPLTLGASCAFMLPISTPPNAIVFGSGYIHTQQMIRVGVGLNLLFWLLIALYSYFTVPLFWP